MKLDARFYQRDDALGLVQCHGTVFASPWLNRLFQTIFGLLNWMDCGDYFKAHGGHHTHTLQPHDPELAGACRPLWVGTWLWAAIFNAPKGLVSLWRAPEWISVTHGLLFVTALKLGFGLEWFVLVTLAPFWFGWIELLVNYPQHAGLPLNGSAVDTTRSLRLPGWLSFLHWRMEYHLEHHLWPAVPCYHLMALRREMLNYLPPRETLGQAWRFIFNHRGPGRCGHGPNPLRLFFQSRV